MERRPFGKTDMQVSALGFGGAEIGSNTDAVTVGNLLDHALDAGLNTIDTSACYGDSEELIGQAVSGRRGDFYIFTKCGHAAGLPTPNWDARTIRDSIDRSLGRLKTDHIDLIQLHSCGVEVLERGAVIEELERAREAGKVRYLGYSGDNEAARWAVMSGRFDSVQTSFNVADQSVLEEIIPLGAARGMGIIVKRPLANVAWRYEGRPDSDYWVPYWERLRRLQYSFTHDPLPEAVAAALRFTLFTPGVSTAIVGTRTPGRWQENARLVDQGPIPTDEYDAIRRTWRETAPPDWQGQT